MEEETAAKRQNNDQRFENNDGRFDPLRAGVVGGARIVENLQQTVNTLTETTDHRFAPVMADGENVKKTVNTLTGTTDERFLEERGITVERFLEERSITYDCVFSKAQERQSDVLRKPGFDTELSLCIALLLSLARKTVSHQGSWIRTPRAYTLSRHSPRSSKSTWTWIFPLSQKSRWIGRSPLRTHSLPSIHPPMPAHRDV